MATTLFLGACAQKQPEAPAQDQAASQEATAAPSTEDSAPDAAEDKMDKVVDNLLADEAAMVAAQTLAGRPTRSILTARVTKFSST